MHTRQYNVEEEMKEVIVVNKTPVYNQINVNAYILSGCATTDINTATKSSLDLPVRKR